MSEPGPDSPVPGSVAAGTSRPWWLRPAVDWRVWVGLGVTGVAVWITLRGVDLREVGRALAGARAGWLLAILPVQVLTLWLRAVRWRWLTLELAPGGLPLGPHFRATAVGFMMINILPLRIGELARPWLLARETGLRGSAALGTVVLERAIDFTTIALVGAGLLYFHTKALPAWVQSGAVIFASLACIPFFLFASLRLREAQTLAFLERLLAPFPGRIGERVVDMARELCRGLAGLRHVRPVAMLALQSLLLWVVVIPSSYLFGIWAFGIDLPLSQTLLATYTALVFTALAVAAPAAPGFFGVYHFACREALDLFGVSSAVAVAYGTAEHVCYWLPTTVVGLVCAFGAGTRLGELASADVGKAASRPHR